MRSPQYTPTITLFGCAELIGVNSIRKGLFKWRRTTRSQCRLGAALRTQLGQEIPSHQQRAGREHDVARHAHPLPEIGGFVELQAACVGIPVGVYGLELRP